MIQKEHFSPEKILEELYRHNKLGPFYIIRPPILCEEFNTTELLSHWCHDFMASIVSHEKGYAKDQAREHLKNHSDFYFIEKNPEHREFKIEEDAIREFFKAQSYPPLESSYKIVAVKEAEKIGIQLANKWLKTLEEPIEGVTTIFLVGNNRPLLKTLESRAITLRLKSTHRPSFENKPQDFQNFLKDQLENPSGLASIITDAQRESLVKFSKSQKSFHYLLDTLKGSYQLQEKLFILLNEYFENHSFNARLQQQWLDEIKWFQKARAYNNNPAERFLGLIQLVQQLDS